jgi:excisionase family DNA binding protein
MQSRATKMDSNGDGTRGLLLIEEAAVIARAPASTIRWWIQVGKLRSVRTGKRRLIPRSALAEALGVDVGDLT